MGNHRSKNSKYQGFYLAHNMLLGLNEVKYSLPITYCCKYHLLTTYDEHPKATEVVAILSMTA
jgi:hypothetical protein